MNDARAGEEIFIEDAKTGETRRGRRRSGGQFMKNGSFSNHYLQFAIRLFTAIKVGIGALVSFVGAVWVLFEFLIIPQIERKMEKVAITASAPIIERLEKDEELFRQHLIDVAMKSALYPTRDDLRQDLDEIKRTLEAIRGQ